MAIIVHATGCGVNRQRPAISVRLHGMLPTTTPARLSVTQILVCGALVVTLSMGIRHGFGLWLQPVTMDRGWTRESFALAIAVQNLTWGLAGPVAGVLGDRLGAFRVLLVGGLLYAAGLAGMAVASTETAFMVTAGVMLGLAQSATTYTIVYGVIARQMPAERRSWAMGMTAAAGSFGQFLMLPLENELIASWGWRGALFALSLLALAVLPLAWGLREPRRDAAHGGGPRQSVAQAVREAMGYRSYQWLMAGYFVCGFQVVFIGVHLPSYLKDRGMSPEVGTIALALIGLFNVFGTYAAGLLGQRWPKRNLLVVNYLARTVAITLFVLAPLSPLSVYLFAAFMGLLWLSTVPPTNAIVAQIFGVQYMSMLGGFVFLSHQVGSFLGAWLGGRLFDLTGSYTLMWWIAAALGLFAAAVNLQVRETAIVRAPTAAQAA